MAIRFAGVAHVSVDARQYQLRGNLTVSPHAVERTMIAGQDGIHGYQELPKVPYIECDLSATPELHFRDLINQVDTVVVAQLANKKQYSLFGATVKGGSEINARDGQSRIRWEGLYCTEDDLSSTAF
jgi:hypothetical protein